MQPINLPAQRLQDRVAIVTGGGQGIGAAICERLAAEGAKVVVADVDKTTALECAMKLRSMGYEATAVTVDMSCEEQVHSLINTGITWGGGRLDVLVNNAARFVFADAEAATNEDWDHVLATNVKGYAFAIKHAIAAMKQNGGSGTEPGGAIINLASISSFIAQPGFVPYSTSKAAIIGLTKCSAMDAGKYGIRVNAVAPGTIYTEGTQRHAASLGMHVQDLIRDQTQHTIIKRIGEPSEVAAAVAFLASGDASFVTGTCLVVDGGYLAAGV